MWQVSIKHKKNIKNVKQSLLSQQARLGCRNFHQSLVVKVKVSKWLWVKDDPTYMHIYIYVYAQHKFTNMYLYVCKLNEKFRREDSLAPDANTNTYIDSDRELAVNTHTFTAHVYITKVQ